MLIKKIRITCVFDPWSVFMVNPGPPEYMGWVRLRRASDVDLIIRLGPYESAEETYEKLMERVKKNTEDPKPKEQEWIPTCCYKCGTRVDFKRVCSHCN